MITPGEHDRNHARALGAGAAAERAAGALAAARKRIRAEHGTADPKRLAALLERAKRAAAAAEAEYRRLEAELDAKYPEAGADDAERTPPRGG